jgi:DNA replication initiation complex subunit (GINS family)
MVLNFGDLQGIYRTEKTSASLQSVPAEFYSEAAALIEKLGGEYREPARKLIEEIYFLRVGKMMRLVSRTDSVPPKNMVPAEEEIYKKILSLLSDLRTSVVGGKKAEAAEEYVEQIKEEAPVDDGRAAVRMLSSMPAIVGSDMSHYGPFTEGDEVRLPRKTARILIEKGAAEEI